METHFPLNPKPKIDLSKTLGKNLLIRDRLISPAYKVLRSITETNSKIQQPQIYDEAINNAIYGKR